MLIGVHCFHLKTKSVVSYLILVMPSFHYEANIGFEFVFRDTFVREYLGAIYVPEWTEY
jgi:hypothetical protein